MNAKISVSLTNGTIIEMEQGSTLYDVSVQVEDQYKYPIILGKIGSSLRELNYVLNDDVCDVSFLDLSHKDSMRVYQRSATFLLIVASKRIIPNSQVIVNHHISGGYFCEFLDHAMCTAENILAIENEMRSLVNQELPITKKTVSVDEAIKYFENNNMTDKSELLKYRRVSTVNLYSLDSIKDYFYGYMVTNVKYIKLFKLVPYAHGFILMFPDEKNPDQLPEITPQPKLSAIFRESEKWARILDVDIVASLNNTIARGDAEDLIKISEALHEKKIAQIADKILERPKVKLVLIAGPSSSGKTTSAQRLCIQLRVNGLKPHVISLDDYFVDREHTPKDEDGKYDFESIDAIDVQLFNEHVSKLIKGEEVEIPRFNFITGQRNALGKKLKLNDTDILIIEGIHGLNEKLSYAIPKENKFKIYVSCLTQLNIDYHNRIPTTDTRLIRRMVRDNKYRGISAEKTIELWSSVRRGENKNIFPFQEEADVMFNSVLIYELAALKQKAEPLLFGIERDSPYYREAKRLLKFLEYFLPIDTATIPVNSILREFVGGSCFN